MNTTDIIVEGQSESLIHTTSSLLRTVIIFVISFLVITSNLVNFIILRRTIEIPPNNRFCLMNLSCADLLLGCLSCAPCIVTSAIDRWIYGDIWCQIAAIVHGTSVTVSIWSLALISVDRYVAIVHPLRYHNLMTMRRCRIVVGCFWCFSSLTFIFPLTLSSNFVYYRYSFTEGMCGMYWGYPWFCIVTAIYIPVLSGSVLSITNYWIIRAVAQMNKRTSDTTKLATTSKTMSSFSLAAENGRRPNVDPSENRKINDDETNNEHDCDKVEEDKISNTGKEGTSCSKSYEERNKSCSCTVESGIQNGGNKSRDVKAVKVLAVTSVTYFIAWGPYVISVVITSFSPSIVLPIWFRFLVMWLANANSFMNVVIYSVMYSSFRKNAWNLTKTYFLCRCWTKEGRINPFVS
ncbi:hypothetical protein LSH36_579g01012 [Paralvinella palmiformis]|uniref:G-protein coupled receptors family 1 profile domain-containing protein n=1 Tax=Paralvinella palmiformis TaxID=53620 RepID=A0AAD9J6F4_9ANNE|nr:hypothetical protein LSH36_579g01012 [Paralvinella palmiformis]